MRRPCRGRRCSRAGAAGGVQVREELGALLVRAELVLTGKLIHPAKRGHPLLTDQLLRRSEVLGQRTPRLRCTAHLCPSARRSRRPVLHPTGCGSRKGAARRSRTGLMVPGSITLSTMTPSPCRRGLGRPRRPARRRRPRPRGPASCRGSCCDAPAGGRRRERSCAPPWKPSAARCRPAGAAATAELRATGETARKREPTMLAQLTPQQLQIVRLVPHGPPTRPRHSCS
jgi:hypothetical protein